MANRGFNKPLPSAYTEALTKTLKEEGGYTVDKSGGATNMGVTQDTLNAYTKKKGLEEIDVKDMPPYMAVDIYLDEYYKAPKINTLPKEIQSNVFDFGVNAGPAQSIKILQRVVGVKADGIIGPKTRAAVNKYIEANGVDALNTGISDGRAKFQEDLYKQNPEKYGTYIEGWRNRVNRSRQRRPTNGSR